MNRFLLLLACLLLAATPACKLFQTAVDAPGNIASDLTGNRKKPAEVLPPSALQTGVMRFADTFAARVKQASQDFAAKAGTPEARIQALTWSINQSTSAYTIATGSNPNLALLDMLVLVSLGRMVHEEYWLPKVWGEADRPMLEAYQQMEEQSWEAASHVLSAQQQEAVRGALREWRDEHPEMGHSAFVKLPVFQDLVSSRKSADPKKGPNLSELLSIDPLGGLEPAVRELEQARLFAERTVFYLQRAPLLIQNQVELLSLTLVRIPEVRGVLGDSERISKAAESLAATAAALPEVLSQQRAGLLADLEQAEGPSRKILGDARATLDAGEKMSAALQAAIASLDKFLSRWDKPESSAPSAPSTSNAPVSSSEPPEPQGRPFDVRDYGESAAKLGAAAKDIDGLLATLDQKLPQVQRVIDEAAARGERAVDHALVRALAVGLVLIGAAALAVRLLRRRAA